MYWVIYTEQMSMCGCQASSFLLTDSWYFKLLYLIQFPMMTLTAHLVFPHCVKIPKYIFNWQLTAVMTINDTGDSGNGH